MNDKWNPNNIVHATDYLNHEAIEDSAHFLSLVAPRRPHSASCARSCEAGLPLVAPPNGAPAVPAGMVEVGGHYRGGLNPDPANHDCDKVNSGSAMFYTFPREKVMVLLLELCMQPFSIYHRYRGSHQDAVTR